MNQTKNAFKGVDTVIAGLMSKGKKTERMEKSDGLVSSEKKGKPVRKSRSKCVWKKVMLVEG